MIGTNAGPHELAGKMCNELFFTTSWQNDDTPEAMGKVMQDQGITDVYVMAPNYAAGKDMVNGFKRSYKGRIVDEVYTRLGQTDYQAELSQLRSKNPKAVFVFYPGGMGISFLRQYSEAGLRGQFPLYSGYTVDEISIPAVKHAALGQYETRYWSPDLKNPANQKYVSDYRKKYGKMPVFYGAQSYDPTSSRTTPYPNFSTYLWIAYLYLRSGFLLSPVLSPAKETRTCVPASSAPPDLRPAMDTYRPNRCESL